MGTRENIRRKESGCTVTQGFFKTNHQILKSQQKAYKLGLKL